jgi:hypothetical protein
MVFARSFRYRDIISLCLMARNPGKITGVSICRAMPPRVMTRSLLRPPQARPCHASTGLDGWFISIVDPHGRKIDEVQIAGA